MAKIILAEDDNDMRRFLVKALQNAGYDVISFDNGLSAYQRLREEPFELLLTDIVMPEMDGIESPALPPWRSIPIRLRRKTPKSSPNRCICASSSARSTKCSPPDAGGGPCLVRTEPI